MCIIVFKPKNEEIPKKEILRQCFINNPDGIGFMFRHKGRIHIKKGYMDFNDFYADLMEVDGRTKRGLKNTDVLIHFRIATHGAIISAQTHPFPVSGSIIKMGMLDSKVKAAIAHNGIIKDYEPPAKSGGLLSDTMFFILENHNDIEGALKKVKDGKFILMTDKETKKIGEFIKEDGIYYSNTTYMEQIHYIYSGYSYNKNYSFAPPLNKGAKKVWINDNEIHKDDHLIECYYCGCMIDETVTYPIGEGYLICNECYYELINSSYWNEDELR